MAIISRRAPGRVDSGRGASDAPPPTSFRDDVSARLWSQDHVPFLFTSPFFFVHRCLRAKVLEKEIEMADAAGLLTKLRDAYKSKDMSSGKTLLAQIKVSFPALLSVSCILATFEHGLRLHHPTSHCRWVQCHVVFRHVKRAIYAYVTSAWVEFPSNFAASAHSGKSRSLLALSKPAVCRSRLCASCSLSTPALHASLQMAMMSFKSMPGTKVASESDVSELLIAREAYELGCLISIGLEEIEGFERHFALVKSCYTDYAAVLPASENQQQLQGLNLLGLLAQSKIAEFHTGLTRPHHSLRPVFARCLVDLCDAALLPSAAYEWSCHLSLTPSLSLSLSLAILYSAPSSLLTPLVRAGADPGGLAREPIH